LAVSCAKALNVSSRLRCLRSKTGNASSAPCPFSSQDHLVGTVTVPPSDRPSQASTLSIVTEPRDELASHHGAFLKAKDQRSSIAGRGRAPQQKRPAHVRFGSGADITCQLRHVRFTPESRHRAARLACPLCGVGCARPADEICEPAG